MNRRQQQVAATALLFSLVTAIHAQETGVKGFFHRAGAALKTTAGHLLQTNGPTPGTNGSIVAETTGPIYKPIQPTIGGSFVDLFKHVPRGQPWPRAALTFLEYGANLPCWTVRATIWQSPSAHHDETFQVCHAPIVATDALGNESITTSYDLSSVWRRTNFQPITHAPSSMERTIGPNPPATFFAVPISDHPLEVQYKYMLERLAWISSSTDHDMPTTDSGKYTLMWTAGFEPAGNHDHKP